MKFFLSLASLVVLARAQSNSSTGSSNSSGGSTIIGGVNVTGIDPALIDAPAKGINFPGCFSDLIRADRNGDGTIRQNEYLGFIQEYGKRRCWEQDSLTLEQNAAFNSLACICRSQENQSTDCCLGSNAHIKTQGAASDVGRTEEQLQYLTAVCVITDGTIGGECPPIVNVRETPPPVVVVPVDQYDGASGGLSDGAKWGIIAAAIAAALLLLLLCCCCCVLKRRRAKALEEEQEEENANSKGLPGDVEQAPPLAGAAGPDSANRNGPGTLDPADGEGKNRGGDNEGEDDYDGEGRSKRGYNPANPEDDPDGRRLRGYGVLPEETGPDGYRLRPPPPTDKDGDPDWDYPGRDINYPKPDPDEMSAQEFDPYNPDGGVYNPQHPPREPVGPPNLKWERQKPEEPDDIDNRKHRIQSGLGEGEVWDKLNEKEEEKKKSSAGQGDVFDWVVQSALGVLDKSDEQGHLANNESAVP